MSGISDIQLFLTTHDLFASCSPLDLARLLPYLKEKKLAAGEILFREGQSADTMYLVTKGDLQVVIGKITATNVEVAGEEIILGLNNYLGEARTATDCELWLLPASKLRDFVLSCPTVKDRASSYLAQNLSGDKISPVSPPESSAKANSWRELIGWLMATILPLSTLFFLRHDTILPSMHSHYYVAILSAVAIMWMFRLLPDFIPVLFALLAMIIFGVAPPATILSGFASDGFFMAMSILGLGTVIRGSGLGFRLLLHLISIRPQSRWWHNLCVFLVGLTLTPIIPSANGRINIVSSFVNELIGEGDTKQKLRESARLSISTLAGASLFSAIFLSSKSINFLMYGYLPEQEQLRFQWTYWLIAASITGLALLIMYQIGSFIFFKSTTPATLTRKIVHNQLTVLGSFSSAEIAALGGIIVFAGSIATSTIHHIAVPWIALSILFALLMFGFLNQKDFRSNIDWSFLFFLGGLIGMVKTMRMVGVDLWLAHQFSWLNHYMIDKFYLFILLLAAVIYLVRLVLPINATAVIFMTLLMPSAVTSGINPWMIGFMILFLSETFIFPYQASYYLQYCSLTGYGYPAQDRRIVPFNLLIMVIKIMALYLSLPWWKHLGLL